MPPRKKTDPPRWVEYMDVDTLLDAPSNAKDHADELIDESIDRFGFIELIILDERTGKLLAGHGRRNQLRRARAAGGDVPDGVMTSGEKWLAPVTRGWRSKDDAEAEAAAIALNRVGEVGGWAKDQLSLSLKRLAEIPSGLRGVGFGKTDVKRLAEQLNSDARLSGDGKAKLGSFEFKILVTCKDEADQATMVEKLEAQGYGCQPVML